MKVFGLNVISSHKPHQLTQNPVDDCSVYTFLVWVAVCPYTVLTLHHLVIRLFIILKEERRERNRIVTEWVEIYVEDYNNFI